MILFRIDADRESGLGHLSRCAAIARALKKQKARAGFLVPPGTSTALLPPGFRMFKLKSRDRSKREAAETRALLRKLGVQLLVVDSYRLSPDYYGALRRDLPSVPVIAVDDCGEKARLPVLGFMGFGLGADPSRYPKESLKFSAIGPEYCPIRDEFSPALRRAERASPARRLLLTMGGGDPEGQTPRIARCLRKIAGLTRIDVVLGPLYGSDARLRGAIAGDDRFVLHRAPRNVATLMSRADLALTAGGTTCNELAFLGIPMIALPLAENQSPMAAGVRRTGCGQTLPYYTKAGDERIRRTVAALAADPKRLRLFSARGREAVDGRGAQRSARFLTALAERYHRDVFPVAAVVSEYERSSKAAEEFAKVCWGSEEGMLNRFRLAKKTARWAAVRRWLDIGCGPGGLLREVERDRRVRDFVGLDLSASLLKAARARSAGRRGRRFIRGSFSGPIAGSPFDLITSIGVLQKCGIPLFKAIALMAENLRPKGQLFVTTKNGDWRRFEEPGFRAYRGHHWFHLGELREAFSAAGLKIAALRGFEPRTGRLCSPRDAHSVFVYARK